MTSQPMSVRVSVEVSLEPQAAFDVFTGEIDAWYRKNERTLADPGRAAAIRFEPGVGGRLLEVHDLQQGGGREMGRITAWEPGRRLVFVDQMGTEVEVRFDGADGQTRVTLEHRGLERLRPEEAERNARHGWALLLPWYQRHARNPQDAPGDRTRSTT